jgi:hypothetical protein
MDNGHARERWEEAPEVPVPVAALFMDGLVLVLVLGNAGDVSEGEEVRPVRLGAGTDKADYAGCDAPIVQGDHSIVLDGWDGGKDGVREKYNLKRVGRGERQ